MFKVSMISLGAALLTLAAGAASAANTDDARQHFQAIAAGDVAAVMQPYADGTRFEWVGGPLDGTYATGEAIRGLWTKFIGAQGSMQHTIDHLEEASNPKGSTVTANVQFDGKAAVRVRYVLTYREGKIVSETWQVDPKLVVVSPR